MQEFNRKKDVVALQTLSWLKVFIYFSRFSRKRLPEFVNWLHKRKTLAYDPHKEIQREFVR